MSNDNEETGSNIATLPTKINFAALKKASASMKRVTSSTQGASFLKFNTSGQWVFGKDDDRAEEGALWAVNTPTLKQGFICWGDAGTGTPLGKEMISVYGDEPELRESDLPQYEGGEWVHQFSFHLMCLNGPDRGKEVVYGAFNQGGREAVEKLFDLLTTMDALDVEKEVPVITLQRTTRKTKYKNNQETPVLNFERLVSQADAADMLEGKDPSPDPEPEAAPAPKSRRRIR